MPRGGPALVARCGDKKEVRIETGLVNNSTTHKSEDHSIDSLRHQRYNFFFPVRLPQIAVKESLRMRRCKNQHCSPLGGNKALHNCSSTLQAMSGGDNSFTAFTATKENNGAKLCVTSDKHSSANSQRQSRQQTGDCQQTHTMMSKRENPRHGFKGHCQYYKGQTHGATPTHTHSGTTFLNPHLCKFHAGWRGLR